MQCDCSSVKIGSAIDRVCDRVTVQIQLDVIVRLNSCRFVSQQLEQRSICVDAALCYVYGW